MSFPYTQYCGFTLLTTYVPKYGCQVLYWRVGTKAKYQTMLVDTPAEARRLARLTIRGGGVR